MPRSEVVSVSARWDEKDARTRELADLFRASAGKLTPILDVVLLHSVGGSTIAAGATVEIEGTHVPLDLADANVDSVRVTARGIANTASVTVQAYDRTNAVVLASVALGTSLSTVTGAWTQVVPKGGNREIVLRVVGNGANDQVLRNVRLQGRTVQFNA